MVCSFVCSFGGNFTFSLKNCLCNRTLAFLSLSLSPQTGERKPTCWLLFNQTNNSKGQDLCNNIKWECKGELEQKLEGSHEPWPALFFLLAMCHSSMKEHQCPLCVPSLYTLLGMCNVALRNNIPLFSISQLSINHLLNESGLVNLNWQD